MTTMEDAANHGHPKSKQQQQQVEEGVAIIWPSEPSDPVIVKTHGSVGSFSSHGEQQDVVVSLSPGEEAEHGASNSEKTDDSHPRTRRRTRNRHHTKDDGTMGIFDSLSLQSSKCSAFRHHHKDPVTQPQQTKGN